MVEHAVSFINVKFGVILKPLECIQPLILQFFN